MALVFESLSIVSPLSSNLRLSSLLLPSPPCLFVISERRNVPTSFAIMCEDILSLKDPVLQMIQNQAYQPDRTLSNHSSDSLGVVLFSFFCDLVGDCRYDQQADVVIDFIGMAYAESSDRLP